MKVALKTFGCRLNISETESIISQISPTNIITSDINQADIIIINSCTVTSIAEKKCLKLINQILNSNRVCIVTGCFDPTKIIRNKNLIYIPLDYKGQVPEIIEKIKINHIKNDKIVSKKANQENILLMKNSILEYFINESGMYNSVEKKRFLNPVIDKRFHSRAFLKIQDGCNHNCSYCKVHIVRGEEQSLNLNNIIDSLNTIAKSGFKEVVLTGINIASYMHNNINFSSLLDVLISKFPSLIFQLSSIEINSLDNKFFDIIKNKNIKPYFHLPLQSGSDYILKLMNRPYNADKYLKIIDKILSSRKDSFISTDVIIGFPGENIETLQQTEKIIRKVGFHHLHLFPFSKREGTAAFNMDETLSNSEKSYFINRFYEIAKQNKEKYFNSFISKKDLVLIEKIEKNFIYGKSYHNLPTRIKYLNIPEIEKGNYIQVNIYGKKGYELQAIVTSL